MAKVLLGSHEYLNGAWEETAVVYPEGATLLVDRLKDPHWQVRNQAAISLEHHEIAVAAPALLNCVASPSVTLRRAVARSLGFDKVLLSRIEGSLKEKVEAALHGLLEDRDYDVRDWAAISLGNFDSERSRLLLWEALDDPAPEVRGTAAEILATFGDRSLLPRLNQMLLEERELTPAHFIAAQRLGDPTLLPAVLEAAERWLSEDHVNNWQIIYTIKALLKNQGVLPPD